MNNRMKKKAEKGNRKLIHQLLDVVLDINGLSKRDQGFTGNSPTVFFDFSGHIGAVDVRVYQQGWKSGTDCDLRVQAHTDQPKEVTGLIRQLNKQQAKKKSQSATTDTAQDTKK